MSDSCIVCGKTIGAFGCRSCNNKKKWRDPEYRRRKTEQVRQQWQDPEMRQKMTSAIRVANQRPEWRRKMSEISKARWQEPRFREKMSRLTKAKKKAEKDYHALANKRGLGWLGPMPLHTHAKTSWECLEGHQWEATYQKIRQGRGCPQCARINQRHPQSDYYALAERRGYHWLGPEVSKCQVKTGWECEQGHRWKASYNTLNNGRGCPFCAGNAPKTPCDFYALAERRGLEWLGSIAPNNRTKTTWRCPEGHEWEASYDSINHGSGCPACRFTTIEREVYAALESYNIKYESQYRLNGRKWIFDAFVPPNILIEVHGDFWHGPKMPEMQDRDRRKAAWAKDHQFQLVTIWQHEIKRLGAHLLIGERVMPLLFSEE